MRIFPACYWVMLATDCSSPGTRVAQQRESMGIGKDTSWVANPTRRVLRIWSMRRLED